MLGFVVQVVVCWVVQYSCWVVGVTGGEKDQLEVEGRMNGASVGTYLECSQRRGGKIYGFQKRQLINPPYHHLPMLVL